MIFVTGGTGMLGTRLLFDLTSRGEKVRALKRVSSDTDFVRKFFSWYSPNSETLFNQIEWFEGDILDPESLRPALRGADKIFHLAAMVSFDRRNHERMIVNNVEGTMNMVELALELKIERFCHVSSIAALGSATSSTTVNEDHAWKNEHKRSAYSESKFQAEMEVWRAIHQGLDAVIVNPSVILGPGKWNSGSPQLFLTVQKGMKFYTKGATGFVDVEDVSRAMIELMFSPEWGKLKNNRYILNAVNLSYREFFDMIADQLGKKRASVFAGKFMLGFAWRMMKLKSVLFASQQTITRETARSAAKIAQYDGYKIVKTIGLKYIPIEMTIESISGIFKKDHK